MGRSTIVSELLLFACLIVLVKIPEITTTPATPLYTKDGFLAGENTPVWLAETKLPHDATYKRIITKTPIVLWAVQRWKNKRSFPLRVVRSIDDFVGNFTSSEEFDAPRDAGEDSFYSPRRVEKRTTSENGVLYPSILVVMSYNSVQRPRDRISSWFYDELVLYALAFWGTVDNSLRNIQNPKVSLRIAGIVITDELLSSPYLQWNDGEETFVNALSPMMNHWRSVAKKNPDFPVGSYDMVVHMTDMLPEVKRYSQKKAILGVSSQGPPCNLQDKIAGVIVYDDLAFNGLDRTIDQMIKVLGGNEQRSKDNGWPLRSWTREILDPISVALQSASCMSAPKEHYPPGAPVAPILAGEIIPNNQQCELLLKDQNAHSCWKSTLPNKRTTCQSLFCSKVSSSDEGCSQVGFPLDGSFCNEQNSQICLAGQCVDKIPEISSEVTIAKPRYAKNGFLAGENTPVWLAETKNSDISYKRIITVTPIVLWAIKHWKKTGSLPLRIMRSVDDSGNFSSPEKLDALWHAREDSFYSPSPVDKRSTPDDEVLYPSILVVMSYNFDKSRRDRISSGLYDELVLYALAFWGSIDNSLRNIQNPRVSLRIAGIVITDTRQSSPYLPTNPGDERFVSALSPMLDHWRSVARKNSEFPVGSYDIVVHMTDTLPAENSGNKAILGVSSQGPPCNLPDEIAGAIVYDDLAFNGLDRTIGQMIHVLGGNEESSKNYGWPVTSWTRQILDPISVALKSASCMSAPKEHHPPGTPVESILPGQVIESKHQCELLAHDLNAWSCWESTLPHKRTTCQSLFCSKVPSPGERCLHVGFPLDGTFCNDEKTKICLDGECIDKISEVTTPTAKPLQAKDGFLAGKDTPVWFAKPIYPNGVEYKRIVSETPIVLRSVEHWKQMGNFPIRVIRSVDNSGNFTTLEELDAPWDGREDIFHSPSPVQKRSTPDNDVLYPSILVVMSYTYVNPPAGRETWTLEEIVLYALAFWGTIDNSLRNIQNPRVSLRIAGIIIAEQRSSFPYLQWNQGDETFGRAFSPMMDHWRSEAKNNQNFSLGSYDIVVHMTDTRPAENSKQQMILGVSSQGPPCSLPDKIAGVIVYDDLAFDGLLRTLGQMIKVLGGNERSAKVYEWPRIRWTTETLNAISNSLKKASCMSAPKERHPPGAPIAPILAGEVMPSKQQCQASGFSQHAWPCRNSAFPNKRTTCQSLFCTDYQYRGETCVQAGLPLDGTFCNDDNTKICLDGECVDKLINAVIEIKDLHGTDLHNSDGISENNNQGPPIENTTPRVINPAVEVKDHDGTDRISANNTQGPDVVIPRRLYEKDGFLAGEETPVWVAKVHFNKSHHRRYRYIRLNIDGTPMVKESLDNWNQLKEGGGFPIRKMSSKDHFSYAMSIADISRDTAVYEKRSADSNEVVYPSVLLVMDYEADPLSIDDLVIKRWTPEQLVTYALAFWGTVDSSLRNIQNPRVSLRIAGIVITKSRAATPYLRYDQNENTIVEALTPMIDYWRSVSKGNNSDFPIGSYDIVVHMTDMCPWYNYRTCKDCTECTLSSRQHHPSLAAASEGPPCKLKDQIGGVIMYDDLAFNGLHRAIAQISKVLGGSDETPWVYGYPRRKWTKKLLNTLSNALKDTSCMAAPKQLFRAGTPVPPILAGEFMPNEKQCELAGYEPDAWACWDTSYESGRSNCYFLKCSNQHIWGVTCSQVGPTLDGSFCNAKNTKICLDGQCVDKY